jgi:hypothetical protein
MKARFFAFDVSGKPLQTAVSAQDIILTENGTSRTVTSVTCPPPRDLQALSAVLTLDISGSMAWGRGKFSNLQLAQQASSAFVRALALPPSEAAVSSFNHESYINQDFTADRTSLLSAINAFQAGGGTDYMNGLLADFTGSIPVVKNGRNKRVVVFLTDGLSDGDEEAVVKAAKDNSVEIYTVAVGLPAPSFIRNIARRTGGVCFENVNDFVRITQVYQAIVQLAQGRTPCEFTWRGGLRHPHRQHQCSPSRCARFAGSNTELRHPAASSGAAFGQSVFGAVLQCAARKFARHDDYHSRRKRALYRYQFPEHQYQCCFHGNAHKFHPRCWRKPPSDAALHPT